MLSLSLPWADGEPGVQVRGALIWRASITNTHLGPTLRRVLGRKLRASRHDVDSHLNYTHSRLPCTIPERSSFRHSPGFEVQFKRAYSFKRLFSVILRAD